MHRREVVVDEMFDDLSVFLAAQFHSVEHGTLSIATLAGALVIQSESSCTVFLCFP